MYRDGAQWAKIRHRILVEGVSRQQVARETGISPKTIRKMLTHPYPQPYGPRSRRYPKLDPHTASAQRMLRENATLPPAARLSVRAMYEHIRDQEGLRDSYGAVKDYVRPISRDDGCIWEYAYDLLISLEKKRAIDFLFCLSRADPPVISPAQAERFFRDFGRITITPPRTDRREQAKRAAFDWMRALLQKEISGEALRCEVGDLPELAPLLQRLYEGRLSDRNRSMVVLATRRGLGKGVVCPFLGIDKKTYRKYSRLFERGGAAALFARPGS
jgi:transposase